MTVILVDDDEDEGFIGHRLSGGFEGGAGRVFSGRRRHRHYRSPSRMERLPASIRTLFFTQRHKVMP